MERQKKALWVKLEKNPLEQLNKLQRELNDTKKKLDEANQKMAVSIMVPGHIFFFQRFAQNG